MFSQPTRIEHCNQRSREIIYRNYSFTKIDENSECTDEMEKFSEWVEKSMFHEYPEGDSRGPLITQTASNRRKTRNYARVEVNKQILCSIMMP